MIFMNLYCNTFELIILSTITCLIFLSEAKYSDNLILYSKLNDKQFLTDVNDRQVSEGYAVLANMYGSKISSVVKEVHKLLQVSENSPAWQSYTAFLDNLISTGKIVHVTALHF